MENTTVQLIETYGAGAVALVFIFGFLLFLMRNAIPAIQKVGEAVVKAFSALSENIQMQTSTLKAMQETMQEGMAELRDRVQAMELKLDYHIEAGQRIEGHVGNNTTMLAEIKGQVRNCTKLKGVHIDD